LSAEFRGKRASPTNHCWRQKTRVIAILCGIKISAVHHLVMSQYTRLTDRQNCDSDIVRCITCSRMVKTVSDVLSRTVPDCRYYVGGLNMAVTGGGSIGECRLSQPLQLTFSVQYNIVILTYLLKNQFKSCVCHL